MPELKKPRSVSQRRLCLSNFLRGLCFLALTFVIFLRRECTDFAIQRQGVVCAEKIKADLSTGSVWQQSSAIRVFTAAQLPMILRPAWLGCQGNSPYDPPLIHLVVFGRCNQNLEAVVRFYQFAF